MSKVVMREFSLILILILMFSLTAYASPKDYEVSKPEELTEDRLYGESDLVIDADTGEVLFSKNAKVRMYPASTTKIMTALLAIETGWDFNTSVIVPQEASKVPSDSSLVPVYPGEETTFGDLLYGLMLHSGNDAANAVAVLIAGSLDSFVQMMNDRAAQLGCDGTHFVNPHGYHDDNHYTTAEDLAKITQEALKHDEFRQIVGTRRYTMHVSGRGDIQLNNSNDLLKEGNTYYFQQCIGVKTGTHSKAGNCFVGAAEKDGVTLISVALKCEQSTYRWIDTIRLFRYAFTRYTSYSIEEMFSLVSDSLVTARISNASKDDPYGGVLQMKLAQVTDAEYERMIQTGSVAALERAKTDFASRCEIVLVDNLAAPISQGEIVGTMNYTGKNGNVVTASLIAARDVAAQPPKISIFDIFPFLEIFTDGLVAILVLLVLILILVLLCLSRAKKRRIAKRRRKIYEQRRREYLRRQMEAERQRKRRGNPPPRRR